MSRKGKKLYRNTDDVWLAGVVSGLADYLEEDVVLLRFGCIVLFILTGFFPLAVIYLIAWVLVPEKDDTVIHDVTPE